MKSIFFMSQTGCFLPLLFLFNLFFGWMFFKPLTWLAIEGIILLLILINALILVRKVSSLQKKHSNVIDVEGEVIEEKKKIK
ncbi:MAG: hypothetical protein WC417_01860 [Candidatus Omnitrophota bacterium]|jgi:uncharacterized membrane protein